MKRFSYVSARSEAEAASLLTQGAVALAGGTDLLKLLKECVLQPKLVVNLKAIPGLDAIEGDPEKGLRIGANATLARILESPAVRDSYPALFQALWNAGTPQIRNMATLGGNLCSRPPCWYFSKESFPCRKKGGTGCPAEGGENEEMAILAHEGLKCHAVHASSAAPALIALGARVRIAGPGPAREIPLEEFFVLPDEANVLRENVLQQGEIVAHLILPPAKGRSATYEVRPRESHDWPLALASVALEMDGAACRAARICLGAVAPVPLRSKEAEAALQGQPVDEGTASKAADLAVAGAKPLEKNAYKVQIARTATKRAILAAAGLPLPRRE